MALNVFRKLLNADFGSSAAVALSKLQTGLSVPAGWAVNEANLATPLRGNYSANVSLAATDILALNTTPITLVAAPSAGYALILDGIMLLMTYVTAYTSANNNNLVVKYTDKNGAATLATITNTTTTLLGASSDQLRYILPTTTACIAPVAEAPLVIYEGTKDPDSGTSTLKLRVFYHIVPTTL
jgi:hypothetical protein